MNCKGITETRGFNVSPKNNLLFGAYSNTEWHRMRWIRLIIDAAKSDSAMIQIWGKDLVFVDQG